LSVALVRQAWTVKFSDRRRPSLPPRSAFAGFRFPPDVIMVAVRLYQPYNLSYRDVEELLLERGVEADHVTVFRWVQRFTSLLADAARFCRHAPGDRWFTDETHVKVKGTLPNRRRRGSSRTRPGRRGCRDRSSELLPSGGVASAKTFEIAGSCDVATALAAQHWPG
jgi:hypothetical protein